ncbi:cobalt-precorrin 5A hydrolase [Dehalobacter sp. DCM]|uniref:cobalt-precorrin 5A hydrolase n=1 Tax=Dehalobacter sp. DCM TaxID=2907827 RepID=UPI0030821932|nr:cobalt-precorrin 5A hydrolase [Dehalobacter sp. DCM]
MKIGILAFTVNGADLAQKIKKVFASQGDEARCYLPEKLCGQIGGTELAEPILPDLISFTGRLFTANEALVFVGACGIAVRAIAPFVRDKTADPAIICLDEKGKFVIPLLSGHIGGANRLADRIAESLQAVPVLTTATDVNNLFAVDEWAAVHDAWISDMKAAKEISARLLAAKPVGFYSELKIEGKLPRLIQKDRPDLDLGICVSLNAKIHPFTHTLNIVPRTVYLGIGCRRGTPQKEIGELVLEQLEKNRISPEAVAGIASIDLKEDEQGLQDFAAQNSLPLHFYTKDQLLTVPGNYTESEFVSTITGVGNVCERAAVLASAGGSLISPKVSAHGVTVALAQKEWRVSFEY